MNLIITAVDSFLDSQSSVENAAVILTRMNDRFKIQYIEILRKLKSVCTTRTFCVAQLNLPNGLMYPQNVAYYMHGGYELFIDMFEYCGQKQINRHIFMNTQTNENKGVNSKLMVVSN